MVKPKYKMQEVLRLGKLATYVPNKRLPVYNWFDYKEGFARDLVFILLEQFGATKETLVLDPFCGVGTTQLACQQRGVQSVGFDDSSLAVFAAQVKIKAPAYKPEIIETWRKKLLGEKFVKPGVPLTAPPIVQHAFSKQALEDFFFFRKKIEELGFGQNEGPREEALREKARELHKHLFLLALVNAAMAASFAKKEGAVIKITKGSRPSVKIALDRELRRFAKDVRVWKSELVTSTAEVGDARKLNLPDSSIDAVITSPPYLNKIDVYRAYAIENYLVFGEKSQLEPRHFIGETAGEWPSRSTHMMPQEAANYFADMQKVIKELARVCKPGGRVAMVVGNGCFPDFRAAPIVDADMLLAGLAEGAGFDVKKILVVNKRWCTTPARKKIGIARESIMMLQKGR